MFKMLAAFVLAMSASGQAFGKAIRIDGSSTVFPITEAVSEEFQNGRRGEIRVTVGISGTGGGFKKFCRGEIDIQNASRPIQSSELEACRKKGIRFFELPIAFDATAVVANPSNSFLTEITTEELKKIWAPESQKKILKWKEVNASWPDTPLKLYGAGSDSGTFDYFTEAIVGRAKASRGDYTPSEDDNILVKGVNTDKNALGYLPFAFYEENKDKLKIIAVRSQDKKAVLPSRQSVEDGSYSPLSRPLFLYVNEASLRRPEVRLFVEYYLEKSPELVSEVKYVPLPLSAYKMNLDVISKGKVGTAFNGHSQVGMKIDQLISKEKVL